MDVSEDLLEIGREMLGQKLIEEKAPSISVIDDETMAAAAEFGADCVISESVCIHVHPDEAPTYFGNLMRLARKPGAVLLFSVVISERPVPRRGLALPVEKYEAALPELELAHVHDATERVEDGEPVTLAVLEFGRPPLRLLKWPSAGPGRRHRAVVSAGGRVTTLEFERDVTEALVDPSDLGPKPRVWRVDSADDEGEWQEYLPPLNWSEDLRGPVTNLRWENDGAVAHRVLVHDDTTGDHALRIATIGDGVAIDWSTLEPSHDYRWRVQHWSGGTWVDAGPYSALSPPAGLRSAPPREPLPNRESQALVRRAYARLDAGDALGALSALEDVPSPAAGSPVPDGIRHTAWGLVADAAGDSVAAEVHFDAALASGAPLPAVLRHCAAFYEKTHRHDRALHCFALLEPLVPGSVERFARRLPPDAVSHYGPLIAPRWLRAPRPLFFAARPVKEAVVRHLGADGAALAWSAFVGDRAPWDAVELPVVSLWDRARTHAHAFEEIVPPRKVHLPAPQVFGEPPGPGISGTSRSVFVAVLGDVVVPSKSNLLLTDDAALMDFQDSELGQAPLTFNVDPVVLSGDAASGLTVARHDADGREPDLDEALSMVGMYTANYGHWVFEKLFKLWACMDRPGFESVPVLIDEQMPVQMRQSLTAFLGDQHPVVVLAPGASVRVARLWVCPTIAYWPGIERLGTPTWPEQELSDVAALAPLVERANTRLMPLVEPPAGRRVLLARSDARLVNRAEVQDWFRNQDFDIVDPAILSFEEQVHFVRSADVIVTEDGSARYGLLFARTGARIGVLSASGHEYEWIGAMLRELGHRLLLLAGAPVGDARNLTWSEYRIDVERLPAFIAELDSNS
jgi:hypothetical protein